MPDRGAGYDLLVALEDHGHKQHLGGFKTKNKKKWFRLQTQSELHSKTPLPDVAARKSCRLTS